MIGCHYNCDCWESTEDQWVCDNCDSFHVLRKEDIVRLSVLVDNKNEPDLCEMIEEVTAQGLDVLYVCAKQHIAKHRYSGRCKDYNKILVEKCPRGYEINILVRRGSATVMCNGKPCFISVAKLNECIEWSKKFQYPK